MKEVKTIKPDFDGDSCTYFRTSDVIPFVDNKNKINMYTGSGASRRWGRANVKSTAKRLTKTVIQVDVAGWHKHTVSPEGGSYYFVKESGKWVRRRANANAVKAALATV